ncbi:MAG: extracellular matrix/biofilm biosynthesis regulator RemA family protein [Fimbriimonas sp.]
MPTPPVLNVGFYNYVLTEKIVALVSSESAPMRRLIQSLRKEGTLIDATQGRRTKSVIFTTGDAVVLSAISQETLAKRLSSGDIVGEVSVDEE